MDIFSSVKDLLKLEPYSIDNNVFRLHYKVTSVILLAFSLIICSKQYFGDPINCLSDSPKSEQLQQTVDTYCWFHSTYTVVDLLTGRVGKDVIYPGVGPLNSKHQETKFHRYYQWIAFVLFFQGVSFVVPHYIWKIWEGGRMKMLSLDLNNPMINADSKASQTKLLITYFQDNLGYQTFYAFWFFICEVLNLVNVIGQILLTDALLGHEFTTYGSDVLEFLEESPVERIDPMARVFPRVTKCTFNVYGPGGNIQPHDAICMLPLNVVNEKIYIFLWFWFIIVAVVSGLGILYRMATILVPRVRVYLLQSKARLNHASSIEVICQKFHIGDWFVLYQLSKNIDPLAYKDLIKELARRFEDELPLPPPPLDAATLEV